MEISVKKKLNILGIGSISTLLILLMVETLMAQIITDTILNSINDNLMLLIIMTGMFLFTTVISITIGYIITKDMTQKSVFKASILSLGCLLIFLFIVSNGSLLISYRNVYSKIIGFEIVPIFPQVLVYFSIYILRDVFNLFILIIIVYYVFFVFFLEKLYEVKYHE
ncbi:hypothetical protein LCGC14_0957740 [marine sediment metagenome]|uniref:Uncharacterized protein n=1 Tax=marine sediment metagenome TaxID=412755 RepID=A0A0F9QYN4_9ZZZZ|nr:hypothetical protein [bacterium]